MGCRFPRIFSFSPEKLVHFWNLLFPGLLYLILCTNSIEVQDRLQALSEQRWDFFSENCQISAPLKLDCSGLSGQQLRNRVNLVCFGNEYRCITWQGLWLTCEVVGLHGKNYSSKNCQMSALLKIDVFGLSRLQMEHLINFILFRNK